MIMLAFAIRDKKAECFMQPWFALTKGAAIRSFTDTVNNPGGENMIAKHPEDFDLFIVGSFSDLDGTMSSGAEGTVRLITGLEVKENA